MLAVCALLATHSEASQFGTGFAVNPKGYLVTCYHVVRGAEQILVHTAQGIQRGHIVALDPANDLAILKVDQWNGRFLGLATSAEVQQMSEVIAAGFPDPAVLGKNPKITKGIVNSLSGFRDDPRYLQVSTPVQPGNSGGPLISTSGRVVGIVAAGLNSIDRMERSGYLPQSVNYAVKAELIYPLLKNASVSVPKLGTRTSALSRRVERAIGAIALVEAVPPGERPVMQLTATSRPRAAAPIRNPWIFPNSHARPLQPGELQTLPPEALWRARNEIYLRHGFAFTTPQGQQFASQFGNLYRPQTASVEAVQRRLSPVEVANLRLIHDFEKRAGT